MPTGTLRPWSFALKTPIVSLSTFFYLSLAFTSSVLAQDVQLRPSVASDSFPACGLSCAVLSQADDGCTPPTVQVTNRQTYVSCFCQSTLLSDLKTNVQGTCDDTCTSSDDRQTLQQWYVDFCNSGGNTDSDSGKNRVSNNNNYDNNGNNNNDNNNGGSSNANSAADTASSSVTKLVKRAPQSWWDGHYKWVIMIIVLAVAFTAITIVGVWLKRRHDRKYPNLYHAAAPGASDSRVFQNRNRDSPVPGPMPRALAARRHDSLNTVSVASSSRTDFVVPGPRQGHMPSRLQKAQNVNDVEVRETPR
ncbi:hypothetical protein BDW62DRAFT_203061 [Aspergillus aurantiobrunneus]